MSVNFINDICVALDQTTCQDNNARSEAEDFLKKVSRLPNFANYYHRLNSKINAFRA